MVMQTKFKLNQRDSVCFHENSGQVNQAYAKNVCDIAILPIGAIEQHGPHCPCG
ncbi:creatininase family protein, partial [Eubacterium aggregans]|uniref:creatininase family protein n=1 Tax=Eubacterium aggregans TaxID=81409 RepID=UPI003F2F1644